MNNSLNLARLLRPRRFDDVIGQELVVRMLKNILFKTAYFPVYLFAGPHGCGKTTTARLFAAAVNCEKLSDFQKNPQTVAVPCGTCRSCSAFFAGTHPDYHEIDAASHTGVDQVREIIDAASLLPVLGTRRVYLIDEAHMLSKAACNALLKILEEPPRTALFMLATTDPGKIIETVTSRCFTLFFDPVPYATLVAHLQTICASQAIAYEDDGLFLIARHARGAVRDALTTLERVALSTTKVTASSVRAALGGADEEQGVELLQSIIRGDTVAALTYLGGVIVRDADARACFAQMIQLIRLCMRAAHGVADPAAVAGVSCAELGQTYPSARWMELATLWYSYEPIMAKTAAPRALLEMIVMRMVNGDSSPADTPAVREPALPKKEIVAEPILHALVEAKPAVVSASTEEQLKKSVLALEDPLVGSIFKQGQCVFDSATNTVVLRFGKQFQFFEDMLKKTHAAWYPMLEKIYGVGVLYTMEFVENDTNFMAKPMQQPSALHKQAESSQVGLAGAVDAANPNELAQQTRAPEARKEMVATPPRYAVKRPAAAPRAVVVDVRDAEQWPIASQLLKHFPGVVVELQES